MGWMIILVIPGVFWFGLVAGAIVEFPKLFGYGYEREEYLELLTGLAVLTVVLAVLSGILFWFFK